MDLEDVQDIGLHLTNIQIVQGLPYLVALFVELSRLAKVIVPVLNVLHSNDRFLWLLQSTDQKLDILDFVLKTVDSAKTRLNRSDSTDEVALNALNHLLQLIKVTRTN